MDFEFWKWRPYKVRSLVSNFIYAKKDRNGPPIANQVASKDEPRRSHTVCTTHPPPPVLPFLLTQNLSLKDITRNVIMKLKCLMTDTCISAMGPKSATD